MNRNGQNPQRRHVVDYAAAASEQMNVYCASHPESPSAVRRPQLLFRGDLWIALLGPSVEEGIVGIGQTVAASLRAFDAQYLVHMPNEKTNPPIKPQRPLTIHLRQQPNA
jgi:hypothetical protein